MAQAASSKVPIISRRLKGLAYLWYGGLDPLTKKLPVAARTVAYQMSQGAVSADLAAALQVELGDAWPFVRGEVDTLTDRAELPRAT